MTFMLSFDSESQFWIQECCDIASLFLLGAIFVNLHIICEQLFVIANQVFHIKPHSSELLASRLKKCKHRFSQIS